MRIESKTIKEEYYGELLEYIKDDKVTDINYDGTHLWIDHLEEGKYKSELQLTENFINQFCTRIANVVSQNFNKYNNILEAETDTLRISIIHQSVAQGGVAISIRKTPLVCRLEEGEMIRGGYASEEVLDFLRACIVGHMNVVFCGLPGSGKTELLKYLTRFIPKEEKVITIEDNLEIHYSAINPEHHCVELKVGEQILPYTQAIKVSLRQNAEWILLSEARSKEVKYLLESFSTGLHGLTTLHTDDVRKVPDRILNMMDGGMDTKRLENDIYTFINVGVLLRKKVLADGSITRYVDQICIYDRECGVNKCIMIMDGGEMVPYKVPENLLQKFSLYGLEEEDITWEKRV